MISKRDLIAGLALFFAIFTIFRVSPIRTVSDSRYLMLFSQNFFWNGNLSLESRAFPELQSRKPGQIHRVGTDLPYQLVQVGERFYFRYPPGNVILSAPFAAIANALGLSAANENGLYNMRGDIRMQMYLAAVLMAGLSVFIFFTSRLVLSFWWSSLIAWAAALGTQIWSTASRAVWSQTWGIFILGVVIWLIVRTEAKQTRLRPVLLATCLSWLYFVRPTFAVAIVAIALYVLIYHRKNFLLFVLTGCIWLAASIGYSKYHFGQALPEYYQSYSFDFATFFSEGFAGSLISPSRGLLIYVPSLIFLAYLLLRYRTTWRPRLLILGLGVVFVHLVMISGFIGWHGGHCYGPRHFTDLVPWFALLAILAVDARLKWREQNRARDSVLRVRTECSFAILLLGCGITLNALGALWSGPWMWNALPVDLRYDLGRLWDWRHPPFLGVPRESTWPANLAAPPDQ
jgi:hypothetical protein